jgi:membrane protein YqaA with SNARE-associated domain
VISTRAILKNSWDKILVLALLLLTAFCSQTIAPGQGEPAPATMVD